jgi:hypothetical protein
MTADALLSRLDRVRRSGPDSHMASCPGSLHRHGDRHPSLHVTETPEGTVLLRCFAGCEPAEIVAAVGLELSDLFPPRADAFTPGKPIRAKVFKPAVFDLIQHEATVIWLIGCDLRKSRCISDGDYERLGKAVATLERIGETAYESR